MMRKLNDSQLQNLEAGKFWGSTVTNCVTEYVGNGCYQEYCDYSYYAVWIRVEHLTHIPNGGMECN